MRLSHLLQERFMINQDEVRDEIEKGSDDFEHGDDDEDNEYDDDDDSKSYRSRKKGDSPTSRQSPNDGVASDEDTGDDAASIHILCKAVLRDFNRAFDSDSGWAWIDDSLAAKLHEGFTGILHWNSSLHWLALKLHDADTKSDNTDQPIDAKVGAMLDQVGQANPYLAGVITSYLEDIRETLSSIQSSYETTVNSSDVTVGEILCQDLESSIQCLSLQLDPLEALMKKGELASDLSKTAKISLGKDAAQLEGTRADAVTSVPLDAKNKGKIPAAAPPVKKDLDLQLDESTKIPAAAPPVKKDLDLQLDESTKIPESNIFLLPPRILVEPITAGSAPDHTSPHQDSVTFPNTKARHSEEPAVRISHSYGQPSGHGSASGFYNSPDSQQPFPRGRGLLVRGHYDAQLGSTPENLHYEGVDQSYYVRDRKFFHEGRVFSVILTENAGSTVTSYNSAISEVRYSGHYVYTQARRFVVVRQKREFCFACPIFTYSDRATLKRGVRPEEHGIAYSEGLSAELIAGEFGIIKRPIAVTMAQGEPNLKSASRIYYGIHHPIQYNVKVKDIGHVISKDLPALIGNWKAEDNVDTKQALEVTARAEEPELADLIEEEEEFMRQNAKDVHQQPAKDVKILSVKEGKKPSSKETKKWTSKEKESRWFGGKKKTKSSKRSKSVEQPAPRSPTSHKDPYLYHPEDNVYGYDATITPHMYHPDHNPYGYRPKSNEHGYHPQSNPYSYHPSYNKYGHHPQLAPFCWHPHFSPDGYHPEHNAYGYHPVTAPYNFHTQSNPQGYHPEKNPHAYHPQKNPQGQNAGNTGVLASQAQQFQQPAQQYYDQSYQATGNQEEETSSEENESD
ncbi:hypothetical protein BKA63DRAFT_206142 [Paraphoma chrysanthemicola]|nr:hypothetical protein BKA63DRAFT_206142 [Paraphoma chrysanthemicola]